MLFSCIIAFLNLLPLGCNSVDITKDPVQELIGQESMEPVFTILLFDMNKEGIFSKVYKHRYRVLKEKDGKVIASDSKWYNVSSSYFQQNENNLGMEMAAKDSGGKIARTIGPPGYTNYIGNAKYGYWGDGLSTKIPPNKTPAGTDLVKEIPIPLPPKTTPKSKGELATHFWSFKPEHIYIRALLQLPAGKIYKKEHSEARGYYGRGFIYYGIVTSGGRRRYGTYSNHYRTNTYNKTWSRGGGGSGK